MIFDLNNIIPHFEGVNRKHYLGELLQNASSTELREFKKAVKAHKKKSKFIPDSAFKPNGSAHDTIIAAINFNLLKRTNWYGVYNALFPIKKLIFWVVGFSLEKHPYHGVRYKLRDRKLLRFLKMFWFLHHDLIIKIITVFILLGTLIVLILQYIDE